MQYTPCVYVYVSKCTEYCWKDKGFDNRVSHWEGKLGSWRKGGLFFTGHCVHVLTSFLPLAKLYLVRPWSLCRSRALCSWSLSVFVPFRPGSRYGESGPNLHFSLLPTSPGSWTIINIPAIWFLVPAVVLQSRASLNCPHFPHHTLSYLVLSYHIAPQVKEKERKWRRSL